MQLEILYMHAFVVISAVFCVVLLCNSFIKRKKAVHVQGFKNACFELKKSYNLMKCYNFFK